MPDKGIQIVIALLEKRESYIISKNSNTTLVGELLRAEKLGYVQRESKSAKYTLTEKSRRWVYSGFYQETPDPDAISAPETIPPESLKLETAGDIAVPRVKWDIREDGRLPGIHACALICTALLLLLAAGQWIIKYYF